MFSSKMYLLLSGILFIFTLQSCIADLLPALYLYSPGDQEYLDVIVKRVGDNLTLACEVHSDAPAILLWNYVAATPYQHAEQIHPFESKRNGTLTSSRLAKYNLTVADSGRYICTSPPYSGTKYILVQQNMGIPVCARGAFACDRRCVLPGNVCDGRPDCTRGQDEDEEICGQRPCSRADRLNCSYGGCIPSAACCSTNHALCSEHDCCREHRYTPNRFQNLELLPAVEDRHAPDDYGFIQSTIYTVTACALIFMIAVVLLVSAICKMHMKRAALRSYAHADSNTRAHYNMHYAQRHRFPPCYEASDLLEQAALAPPSPLRETQCPEETQPESPTISERRNTRLSALASVFSSRYRQVPTQCAEVEMTSVGASTSGCCEPQPCIDDRHRLTLQLGRFHLSIPSFRRNSEPRPDTPNVAEINLDDIDLFRLNSDTYTLNGRTIRLLGGNFENYPMLGGTNPPPYNEAMRYKLYGPPPEYLSRDRLNRSNSVDDQARSNIELPPGYEELSDSNTGNHDNRVDDQSADQSAAANVYFGNRINFAVDSNLASPTLDEATNGPATPDTPAVNMASAISNGNLASYTDNLPLGNNGNLTETLTDSPTVSPPPLVSNLNASISSFANCETLNSVIDNLPAIDSDVNANDEIYSNNNNLVV